MLWVGTSGWQYADWRGQLYPAGLPQRLWLARFTERFPTVEVNSAFYRLPARETFEGWAAQTPADFVVAVKVSRYLTHVRRLSQPAEPVQRFLERAGGLDAKLGPVLLQLPPNLPADAAALDETLSRFPRSIRVAVEPRHPTWWSEEVRAVLAAHGAALCWADRGGRPTTPLWRTTGWAYLRMHGGRARPSPGYGQAAIDSWLRRLADRYDRDHADMYVYFNNDHGAAAVRDAVTMTRRARRQGWRLPREATPP